MPRIPDRFAGAAIGLSVAAGVLVAYMLTLAPEVVWSGAGIDSGDLAAAVAVGGVPHPTGYPTLMLLGLAVRAIPLGDLALRLNVLTALAAAASLMPLGLLAARLRPGAGTVLPVSEAMAVAAVLALYGLAPLVWSNAIVTEVYAFASLFLWTSLYAAARALAAVTAEGKARWAAAAGVLLGLGTGAHITVALGAPALAVILALALIALIGVPPTGIFIAKLYVFTAAVDSGLAWLAIVGVVNSAVSAYYYVRIIRLMFLQQPPAIPDSRPSRNPAPWAAMGVAAAVLVFMGVAPGFVMTAAGAAVRALGV